MPRFVWESFFIERQAGVRCAWRCQGELEGEGGVLSVALGGAALAMSGVRAGDITARVYGRVELMCIFVYQLRV